jgi:peptidoglycan/xylan/chitin deacetylase (PgdA/CDA1 family)
LPKVYHEAKGKHNRKQALVLLLLIVFGLGLPGCHTATLPTPQPTPTIDSAEIEMRLTPPVTGSTTPIVESTLTLPPTDSLAGPSPTLAITPKLLPLEPTAVTHGDRSRPYIALTFDACQTPDRPTGYDEAIINILTETETPATLFLGGLWMQWHPTQTQALAANPLFELANHSWSHPDFTRLNPEEMSAEIVRTQQIMYTLTGQQATLFRFPFDLYPDEAVAVVSQHGLRVISGDVITGDADPNVLAQAIVHQVTAQVENGSIVMMHMNARGWHTAEALPVVIRQLREEGYTFVTVSQLLGLTPLPTLLD